DRCGDVVGVCHQSGSIETAQSRSPHVSPYSAGVPVLSARDRNGRVMVPGDRVAVPISGDSPESMEWAAGSVLGFGTWDKEALVLLLPVTQASPPVRLAPTSCWRLGSRGEH